MFFSVMYKDYGMDLKYNATLKATTYWHFIDMQQQIP